MVALLHAHIVAKLVRCLFCLFQDLDVVITSVQPGRAYPASLSKRVEDFRAMLSNPSTWLDDHAMDHAQALLKAQYPNINGLYATTTVLSVPMFKGKHPFISL